VNGIVSAVLLIMCSLLVSVVRADYTACAFTSYATPAAACSREMKISSDFVKKSKSLIIMQQQSSFIDQNSEKSSSSPLSSSRRWDETSKTYVNAFGRRSMIMQTMLLCTTLVSNASAASGEDGSLSTTVNKPFAPLEALLPATRLRMAIDQAVQLANEMVSMDPTAADFFTRRSSNIAQLEHILYDTQAYAPPPMLPKMDSQKSKLYDQAYAQQLRAMSPGEALMALPVQLGERNTAARLKRRQKKLEKNDPVRGALNFYTSQLQFNTESYVLNAAGSERKRLIRDDALPDVKSTIVSDLDLRDLLRNQMLDLWEDAAAELRYQTTIIDEVSDTKIFDATELSKILLKLQEICTSWFEFIPDQDVKKAAEAVLNET